MLTIEEARSRILAALTPLGAEVVGLERALGRVTAAELLARRALPRFDNSAMDGYAVRAADTERAPVRLRVVEKLQAGQVSQRTLGPGEAARIFTGAPLPHGADAIVMQEEARADGDLVEIPYPTTSGKHVRATGEDLEPGDLLCPAGQRLGPGELGALASQGILRLAVSRLPRVAVVPTGDELVEIDREPGPGQVSNGNALMLAAQVSAAGGLALTLPPAPDELSALARRLRDAAATADLVLTCGGVSVGDFDYVRDVLGAEGRVEFFSVAMKPGKPLAFGALAGTPLIGLPGNPVSAFVGFELFARPAIARLAGLPGEPPGPVRLRLATALTPDKKRRELVRARLENRGGILWAEPLARRGSHHLSSLLGVQALLDVPPGQVELATGTELDGWLVAPAQATATSP